MPFDESHPSTWHLGGPHNGSDQWGCVKLCAHGFKECVRIGKCYRIDIRGEQIERGRQNHIWGQLKGGNFAIQTALARAEHTATEG